jgi:N-acetyl-gamma-glutamyl-phosphate reductase
MTHPLISEPPAAARPPYRVGIYGATGYTGQVLIELIRRHPHAEIAFATSEHHTHTEDGLPLVKSADAPLSAADVVFLALPNGVSGGVAAQAIAAGVKVIDLSADLRLDTPDLYSATYKMPHPAPHLLPTPYGLPEINRAELVGARAIANPGCHVTATLLALYPLAKANALTADPIIVDTKTGVSGAGREPKLDSLFGEVYGDVRPYNIGRKHRHVPEIEQALHKIQPGAGPLIFAPHLVPVHVGLLATVYVRLAAGWDYDAARAAFESAYAGEPLVRLLPAGKVAQFKHAAHTNGAVVAVSEGAGNTIIITAAIDNLRKGASAQAVQNFNIMMGLPETAGLL